MLETIQWSLGNLHQVGTHSHTKWRSAGLFDKRLSKTMRVLSLFFIFITTLHSSENIFTNSQNKIGQIGYRLFIRFGAMMLSCVREFRLCSARFVWYLECRKLYGHFCRLHRAGGTEDVRGGGNRPPILVKNWKQNLSHQITSFY